MIRKLMASSAMIALVTAGTAGIAQAQTDPAMQQNQPAMQQPATGGDAQMQAGGQAQPELNVSEAKPTLQPEQPTLATAFIGKSVYSSQDPEADNIGNVNDLIISDDGTITHAVVGVGGFLGIGEKNVAVPFEELQIGEREGDLRLIYAATREDLEAAEEFDRTAYDPEARSREQDAGGMTTAPQTSMAPAGGQPMETTEQNLEQTGEQVEQNVESAAAETEETVEAAANEAGQEMQEAGAEIDQGMESAEAEIEAETNSAEPMVTETTQAPAAPGGEQEMAVAGEEQAEATMSDTQTASSGFRTYDASALRASTLMGREVYGEGDESIGEVSDLVLQPDGGTRAALIDVGGFLGVGEKEVAIPFSEIQVQQGQEGEEPRLTVAMTRDQLDQLQAYERPEQAAEMETAPTADQTQMAAGEAVEGEAVETEVVEAEVVEAEQMAATDVEVAQGGMMAASQDLSADELLGQAVYGANEDSVGDIGDLVFTPDGQIDAVVIDVGGFLGIGEKPVAVQYDALNIMKNGDDTRIMLNATEEQLENAPSYDEETATVQ